MPILSQPLMICLAAVCGIYAVYVAIAYWIARGIHNRYARQKDIPTVSIVIPARNEESQIGTLLNSLLEVDYPAEHLQIVVANDQSTDGTRSVLESYANRFECRFDVCEVQDEPEVNLRLKTRALCQGMDRATGDIILMTDADCMIPREWVRSMVSYFSPGVGMVCGTTLPVRSNRRSLLSSLETLDWMFLLGASSGLAGKGHPKGVIGNNFSVRRSTYERLGTYRSLERTDPYDDLALMNAVRAAGDEVVFPADQGCRIFTQPTKSLYEIARQRRRWLIGAQETGWLGIGVIGFALLAHLSLAIWPLLLDVWGLLPAALLILGNVFVLAPMLRCYQEPRLRWLLPFYPLFAATYAALIGFILLRGGGFNWKGRELKAEVPTRGPSVLQRWFGQPALRRLRTLTGQGT